MNPRLALGISVVWLPLAFLFDGVTALVLPVRLADSDRAATEVGLVSFAGLSAALVVQPLAGRLSDRLRGRIDRRVFLALAALPAVAGLWLLAGATAVGVIALAYVVIQISASAIQAAQQTLIPEHVDHATRGRAAGLKSTFDIGGAFLAFLVLGALLQSADVVPAAAFTTVLLLASVGMLVGLVPRATPSAAARRTAGPGAVPTGFVRLVAARFLFLFGTYAIGRFLLLLLADRLGLDPGTAAAATGGLLALLTLATAVAALPFGLVADRRGRSPVMAVGIALSTGGILAFLPTVGMFGVVVGGLLMAAGTAAFVSANWAAITDLAPAEDAGWLMGLANVGTGGAAASAGLLGPVIDGVGFSPAIILAAIATAAALIPLSRAGPISTLKEQA